MTIRDIISIETAVNKGATLWQRITWPQWSIFIRPLHVRLAILRVPGQSRIGIYQNIIPREMIYPGTTYAHPMPWYVTAHLGAIRFEIYGAQS